MKLRPRGVNTRVRHSDVHTGPHTDVHTFRTRPDSCLLVSIGVVSSRVPTAIYRDGVPTLSLTDLRTRRGEILELARARGASRVRVFGSIARGDATDASDIDFLVELAEGRSLLDLGGLLMDLRDLLGHDVDVVTESSLRPRVATRVLADAVDL